MNTATKCTFGASWFDVADHTAANETGSLMIINAAAISAPFFQDSFTIEPDTDYFFSCWAMNICRTCAQLPKVMVQVTGEHGEVLFEQKATEEGGLPVTKVPTWVQVGAIIPMEILADVHQFTVSFLSIGAAGSNGNDFCIDDVSCYAVRYFDGVGVSKTISQSKVVLGDWVTYRILLQNATIFPLYGVALIDTIPKGVKIDPKGLCITCSQIQEQYYGLSHEIGRAHV